MTKTKDNVHRLPGSAPVRLTEEEMKMNQARFFMQKRESFAQGILYNFCNNPAMADAKPEELVKKAVETADHLMKSLFVDPVPEFNEIGKEKKEDK